MATVSRRDFLKGIAAGTAGVTFMANAADASETRGIVISEQSPWKIRKVRETYTVCAFCGCGCGILLYTNEANQIVFAEGDPDHPINRGSVCSKGGAIIDAYNVVLNKKDGREINRRRVLKPLYRAPGSNQWEEKTWDWTIKEVAKRVKETRDASFEEKDENGVAVNRTTSIAAFGSASLDNEENYLLHKMFRSWGMLNIEHHARL